MCCLTTLSEAGDRHSEYEANVASTASEVIPSESFRWNEGLSKWGKLTDEEHPTPDSGKPHIVAMDFGMKWNIHHYH